MHVYHHFDGGVVQPFEISGTEITFDLRPGQRILNVLLRAVPEHLGIALHVDERSQKFILGQGLLISKDGETFTAVPVEKTGEDTLRTTLSPRSRDLRIATRYPYGRDALDQLLCDTRQIPHANVRILRRDYRTVPVFSFGRDAEGKWHHYFMAGEDVWETAGCWVADEMVRILSRDRSFADRLLETGVVHIVPLASPYSATLPGASYTTLEGKGIYGAATWGDPAPPPEYALLRDDVTRAIEQKRLGLLLTIHSWQAQSEYSGLETIRTAGENALEGARLAWASQTLDTLIDGVPNGQARLPERIWHAGLARDHLLARHNTATFRVEITTLAQGPDGFKATARQFLENLSRISDWGPVCNP